MTAFSYRTTRDGKVFLAWQGRDVTTLKGLRAARFVNAAEGADEDGLQFLMARATGHFKHGNER